MLNIKSQKYVIMKILRIIRIGNELEKAKQKIK